MFGFSFTKVIVLVAIVSIVWFGFRWFERWQKETREREEKRAARLGGGGRVPPGAPAQAEEMTACGVCGTYVAAASARSCGKPNCPFPR